MASTAQPAPGLKSPFALRDFRKLWAGQFISIFGDLLAIFGVISLITFRWHGTASQVTYVLISYMLPLAIFSPIAGVFVDRWHVKPVMISSDLTRGVLALSLVRATDVPELCGVFVALALLSSFFSPAMNVTVRTIVPEEQLLAANALLSQASYAVRLLAPVAAGTLVASLGERWCFYLDSLSFFFSAAMVATINVVRVPAQAGKSLKGFFGELTSGNRFILTHPSLAFVITSMVGAMFVMSCLSPLFSIYVRDVLHSGTFLYGLISSVGGVGLILGTQAVTRFGKRVSNKARVVGGLLVCGAGLALLAISRMVAGSIMTTLVVGLGIAFVTVSGQTLMQQETPPQMLGRVTSSFMSVFSLAQVLGLLLAGHLAVWLGIREVFLVCASALMLIAALGHQRHRAAGGASRNAISAVVP
jgi:MFS family permease